MADKRKYNAKLNAKGLENVLTEQQAGQFARNQGSHGFFIIEAHAGPKMVDEDGSETVNMIPDQVEFVPAEQEDRVRRFQRALYLARPDQFGQEAFDGATPDEPRVADTAAELDAAVETDDAGEVTGTWQGDPAAPLPTPADGPDGEPEDKGDDGLGDDNKPWPGDGEAEGSTDTEAKSDDVAAARAKRTRKAAAGS